MKHLQNFESFSQENITNEGWKEFKSTLTKPFREKTDEEIEIEAEKIINDLLKMNKIEKVLKNHTNQLHYKNYLKTKNKFDNGDKMPFYKFIIFIKNNLPDLMNNRPIYYSQDFEDTRNLIFQGR